MDSNMDSNYVFLCGVMWCRFGQQDAGKELLRAADSGDPDMKVLARAMFANGMRRLRESEKPAQPVPAQYLGENHLEPNHVDQIMRVTYRRVFGNR